MIPTPSAPHVTKAVVIYHDNCCDGFGAAWAFYRLAEVCYSEGTQYAPRSYGQAPEIDLDKSTDVYILDFSYDRDTLRYLAANAASVTILDHHKTAEEALSNWSDKPSNLEIIFDQKHSGARISWEYFSGTPNSPSLIKYIEDRDLWRHELPDTKEINALIGFSKKKFEAYDAIHIALRYEYVNTVARGEMLLEVQQRHCASIIAASKRTIEICGYAGLVCNAPGQFASDIGNMLALESGTFGATYFQASDGSIKFSLRSIGDFDVSEIAKQFGGGGHKNAAGFVLHNQLDTAGISLWTVAPDHPGLIPQRA